MIAYYFNLFNVFEYNIILKYYFMLKKYPKNTLK
jgi:hypothetical protein